MRSAASPVVLSLILLLHPRAECGAQQAGRALDPLTDQETEELRDAATFPVPRVELYIKDIDERMDAMRRLIGLDEPNLPSELRRRYQAFTALADELEDNLDTYDDQHADLRKALKLLTAKTAAWTAVVNEPRPDAVYDIQRKEAVVAIQALQEDTRQRMLSETKYFAERKKSRKNGG